MKAKELREMTDVELNKQLKDLKAELFNLRFQHAINQLDNPVRIDAVKKDIARVFDAETCILGVFSGVLGIVIAWLLTFPVNTLIYNVSELENVAQLQPLHALLLIVISTLLTMLGGHIPARMASRKNAVDALRSE